jgi:bisphosphoglycerate-dependent phosphoglycerate mutase
MRRQFRVALSAIVGRGNHTRILVVDLTHTQSNQIGKISLMTAVPVNGAKYKGTQSR